MPPQSSCPIVHRSGYGADCLQQPLPPPVAVDQMPQNQLPQFPFGFGPSTASAFGGGLNSSTTSAYDGSGTIVRLGTISDCNTVAPEQNRGAYSWNTPRTLIQIMRGFDLSWTDGGGKQTPPMDDVSRVDLEPPELLRCDPESASPQRTLTPSIAENWMDDYLIVVFTLTA